LAKNHEILGQQGSASYLQLLYRPQPHKTPFFIKKIVPQQKLHIKQALILVNQYSPIHAPIKLKFLLHIKHHMRSLP
jgi:hypothetical protein